MTGRGPGLFGIVAVVAVATGVVTGASALPSVLPSLQPASAPVVEPLPVSLTTAALVCPGPETLLAPDGGATVDSGAAVLITSLVAAESGGSSAELRLSGDRSAPAAAAARTPPAGLTAAWAPVTRGRSLRLSTAAPGPAIGSLAVTALGPALLRTTSVSPTPTDPPPSTAAVQSTLVTSGDLRSLTATTCTAPESDSWLVGGSTEDGNRLRLLLANPAAAAAVVDIDVRGPRGRVRAPSGEGVVVPAGGEVPIFVDALAPGLKQVALHVTTRSGRVRATLHDSRMQGLSPAGADDVPVAAAPAKRQMIPGISLVNGFGKGADDPDAPGSTAVRIAVPGAEEAVARVRLLDSSGAVELPRAGVVSVPAGGVVDVPVSGIPSGTYTAVVDSDVPVVAGARIGRGGAAGTDPATGAVAGQGTGQGASPAAGSAEFAWAAAARPLAGSGYLVLPPAVNSTLSLVAPRAGGRVVVSPVRRDGSIGEPEDVDLAAGTSSTVRLAPDAVAVQFTGVSGGPVGANLVSWVSDPRGSLISVLAVDLPPPLIPPTSAVHDRTLG